MQRAFAEHNESADEAIRVRIGLNAGEPIAEDDPSGRGDLFGTAVNMAARIAAKAEGGERRVAEVGGQLVVGKEIRQLSRDRLTFGMIVGIPLFQILLFGSAINLDVRHLRAGAAEQATTHLYRQPVAQLEASTRVARGEGAVAGRGLYSQIGSPVSRLHHALRSGVS